MSIQSRVSTGISGLDAMLRGGFLRESAILVRGAPGTGKTTLAMQFLLEGARQGEAGLFVSFEEFPKSLYRDAESVGWDLKKYEADGSLKLLFTSPQVLMSSLEMADSPLVMTLLNGNIQRVVVDSLTHYTRITSDSLALRHNYNQIINAFRREGVTAMFLGEEMRSDYTASEKGHLPFLVDCFVMLRYLEIESAIQRAILVLKMRSSDHDKAIHSYSIGPGGLTVGNPLEGRIGLLSGLSQHSIISTVQTAK